MGQSLSHLSCFFDSFGDSHSNEVLLILMTWPMAIVIYDYI